MNGFGTTVKNGWRLVEENEWGKENPVSNRENAVWTWLDCISLYLSQTNAICELNIHSRYFIAEMAVRFLNRIAWNAATLSARY